VELIFLLKMMMKKGEEGEQQGRKWDEPIDGDDLVGIVQFLYCTLCIYSSSFNLCPPPLSPPLLHFIRFQIYNIT
jgi:hypothetical protein